MISFNGGPANGRALSLRRAPIFLRVVIDTDGHLDALDQVHDSPRSSESIHVYRIVGDGPVGFACTRGNGCSMIAEYLYFDDQPADAILRDNDAWSDWAFAQYEKEKAAAPAPSHESPAPSPESDP